MSDVYAQMTAPELMAEACMRLGSRSRELARTSHRMGYDAIARAVDATERDALVDMWLARLLIEGLGESTMHGGWVRKVARAASPALPGLVLRTRRDASWYATPVELLEVAGLEPHRAPRVVVLAAHLVWRAQVHDVLAGVPAKMPRPSFDPPPPRWVPESPQWVMWDAGEVVAESDQVARTWTPRAAVASWVRLIAREADVEPRVWLGQGVKRARRRVAIAQLDVGGKVGPSAWLEEEVLRGVSDAWRQWWGTCTWPARVKMTTNNEARA